MRFFDKTFFKFLLGFALIILISLGIISYAKSAYAALVNINTATIEELDILPGVGPVTAQSIIDNRPYASVEEISRADGIGEPGSPSYENIISLITVGDTGGSDSGGGASNNSAATSTSTSYSAAWLSNTNTRGKLEVNVGKDKASVVGTPIEFKAEVNFGYTKNNYFQWSFGDGSVDYGAAVTHAYLYPGEYVAVLRVSLSEGEEATARLNVKIADPKLSITFASPERIEVTNSGKNEVNLFGRVLVVGDGIFAFPKDTIIKAGQSISFSSKVTGLAPTAAIAANIFNPGTTEQPKIPKLVEEEKHKLIAQTEEQLRSLEIELARVAQSQNSVAQSPSKGAEEQEEEAGEEVGPQIQTASAAQSGWVEKIKRFLFGR